MELFFSVDPSHCYLRVRVTKIDRVGRIQWGSENWTSQVFGWFLYSGLQYLDPYCRDRRYKPCIVTGASS